MSGTEVACSLYQDEPHTVIIPCDDILRTCRDDASIVTRYLRCLHAAMLTDKLELNAFMITVLPKEAVPTLCVCYAKSVLRSATPIELLAVRYPAMSGTHLPFGVRVCSAMPGAGLSHRFAMPGTDGAYLNYLPMYLRCALRCPALT
eukprot:3277001-Rhodomonas_salina.2